MITGGEEEASQIPADAASGEKGAEDGVFGDGGGVARGGRARVARDGRVGADGGRGRRRRRVGGGILSKGGSPSVSGSSGGRVPPEEHREDGGAEVSRGEENGKKPWID